LEEWWATMMDAPVPVGDGKGILTLAVAGSGARAEWTGSVSCPCRTTYVAGSLLRRVVCLAQRRAGQIRGAGGMVRSETQSIGNHALSSSPARPPNALLTKD
jgi:hypothetical protein